ncbi:MAG TPA: site-specific integrase [Patescibacteria group bacterium]|nr:site-specific integrase [Patescibacteria group bacterium]
MELLNQFHQHLLQDKNKPSKLTVKNYLADIRKFLRWFETKYARSFVPRLVTKIVVEEYKNALTGSMITTNVASANSLKRYLSSLRKFYQFLLLKGFVENNPFQADQAASHQQIDTWHSKAFINFLLTSHASKPTIKNYLVDIRQFTTWFENVTGLDEQQNPLAKLNAQVLEEYKSRLLYDASFEPRSVNRKLSSLRKYLHWLENEGLIKNSLTISHVALDPTKDQKQTPEEALRTFSQGIDQESHQQSKQYSSFPPLRLLQKLHKLSNHVFDLLIIYPVAKSLVAIKYLIWKQTGSEVFVPVKTLAEQAESGFKTATSQTQSLIDNFVVNKPIANLSQIRNLPKAFYAPMAIATTNLPAHRKILHHIRHTRPAWYKRYHSYAFVHYLHFGVALIYATILGLVIYQALIETPRFSPAVASAGTSPPRMIAFEGRLTDRNNVPITAEKNLRFGLYNDPTASRSAMLWQETQQIQPDSNGNFSTFLGQEQPIAQSILNDNPSLFLGISIGNDEELKPRQQIATVAYSQDSEKVQGLSPITDPTAGTKNVLLALDSGGDLTIGGTASPRFEATGGEFTLAGYTLTLTTSLGSNTNVVLSPDGAGFVDIQKPIQNTTNYIGLSGIEGALEIADSVAITTSSATHSALFINQNSTGNIISASSGGTAKFTLNSAGSGMFASDLAVNGNSLNTTSSYFSLVDTHVIDLRIGSYASSISLGSETGQTLINNSLKVQGATTLVGTVSATGKFTANGGLNVRGSQQNDAVAKIENTNTSNTAAGLEIKLGNNTPGTDNSFILFKSGDGKILGEITGSSSASIAYKTNNADYAEYYKKASSSERFEQGDLVCLSSRGGVTKCTGTQPLLGVVSATAGFVGAGNRADDPDYVLVGIVGQLPVKVAPEGTTIASGDPLAVTSQGVVKATQKTTIIGHALAPVDSKTSMVQIALNINFYDPALTLNESGDIIPQAPDAPSLSDYVFNGIIENITAGMIEAQILSVQSLSVATDNITIGEQTLREYIIAIVNEAIEESGINQIALISPIIEADRIKTNIISPLAENDAIALQFEHDSLNVLDASGSAVATIDNQGNASFSGILAANEATIGGTLRAGRLIADEIVGLDNKLATLAAGMNNIASNSATPTVPRYPDGLPAQFDNGLLSLAGSSFTDVAISNNLRLADTMVLSQTSINTIGADLSLQSFRQGNLSLMGDLVRIDTQGNLFVEGSANFAKDVEIRGTLAANKIMALPGQDVVVQLGTTGENTHDSLFMIHDSSQSAVLTINQAGDILASGAGNFINVAAKAFTIIRGAQADTSFTTTEADGSAGEAVITANERERTIVSPYMQSDSLVYITATSNTQGVTPYVTRQTETSFTVQIPQTVTKDIKFNWWIVN